MGEMTDQQRRAQEQIEKLRVRLAFYEEYPELVGYVPEVLPDPSHLDLDDDDLADITDPDRRQSIRERRRARAQVRALRDAGFEITKLTGYDEHDMIVKAERWFNGQLIKFRIYLSGWCQMVDTGEVERVPVVQVPDEVAEAYTTVEVKPIRRKVCGSLFNPNELEEL